MTAQRRGRLNVGRSDLREVGFGLMERWALVAFFIASILFFSVDPTTGHLFRTSANIRNILTNQSVTGLIALAMIVPLAGGYFDLAVPAIAAATNIAMAAMTGAHHSIWLSIIASVAIGAGLGGINGLLIAGLRLNAFVVTLGMYTFIQGLTQLYTGSQTLTGVPVGFSNWSTQTYGGIPRTFVLLIVVAVALWYVLMHTPFGRRLEGIGSNQEAARLVGVRVERAVFFSFLLSGTLGAGAGVLLTSTSAVGDATAAPGYLFPAIAAVFIGTTTIRPGRFNVWGTMVGVFLVAVVTTGLTLLGAASWITDVFDGGALVVAVTISTLMGRRRDSAALKASQRQDASVSEPSPPVESAA